MRCPKCNSIAIRVTKLSDHPAKVAECICGFYAISISGKADKAIEALRKCQFCKINKVKTKKAKFCSADCYARSMERVVPEKGSSLVGAKKKGALAYKLGKDLENCPYMAWNFVGVAYRKAWIKGFRSAERDCVGALNLINTKNA